MLLLFGLGIGVLTKTPDTLSLSERRDLAAKPALSLTAVTDGSYFNEAEKYLLDQFPLRDGLRRLTALCRYGILRQKDNHGIILKDGHAAQLGLQPGEKALSTFLSRMNKLQTGYFSPRGMTVYTTLIPDKMAYFTGLGYPAADYDALREAVAEGIPGRYIDIFDSLSADCYYRTDPHWRQQDLPETADTLLAAMGRPLLTEYRLGETLSPFYGAYCGESALPLPPDEITPVHTPALDSARAFRAAALQPRLEEVSVYFEELIDSRDPYDVFLGGARGVIALECTAPTAENEGRVLCLFSDSFGRSLAPLLLSGYEKVFLYDIRYMPLSFCEKLLPMPDGADVLLAYSVGALAESANLQTD